MATTLDPEVSLTINCLQIVNAVCDLVVVAWAKSPVILLISWWLLCLYFQLIVLNLFPLFLLIWFSFKWKNIKEEPPKAATLSQLLLRFEQRLDITKYFSWEKGYARNSFLYLVSAYFVWISLQQVFTLPTLFITVGSAFIVWESDWFLPIRRSRFFCDKSQDRLWERVRNFDQETIFLFEIYENQRFNFFNGQWEGTTFPFERSPWTDCVHYPVSSKSQIALPYFWEWIDDDWSADLWSYSSVFWTNNSGNKWYHNKTRRRRWTRTASTMNVGSSRRRSSVFYSQKSTVYEFPLEDKTTVDQDFHNDKQDTFQKSTVLTDENTDEVYNTPLPSETKLKLPSMVYSPKPQPDALQADDKNVINPPNNSISTIVAGEKNEFTSFHRRSKRLSSTTASRDAIWKSIAKV